MKGNLFLDYYSNRYLNKTSIKCRVSITQPNWFSGVDHNLKSLYPSPELLKAYKNGELTAKEYTAIYVDNLMNYGSINIDLDLVRSYLDAGRDVSFLCWCGPDSFCHRLILGTLFYRMGYKVFRVRRNTIIDFDGSY